MSRYVKPGSFSYKIKHLILEYIDGVTVGNVFKEKLDRALKDHPMQPVYAAAAICRWIDDHRFPDVNGKCFLTDDDIRCITSIIIEVNPKVGVVVYRWAVRLYGITWDTKL